MQTHPIRYPTDLNDEEWDFVKSLVGSESSRSTSAGRKGAVLQLVMSPHYRELASHEPQEESGGTGGA